jgi:hypothetical protein
MGWPSFVYRKPNQLLAACADLLSQQIDSGRRHQLLFTIFDTQLWDETNNLLLRRASHSFG